MDSSRHRKWRLLVTVDDLPSGPLTTQAFGDGGGDVLMGVLGGD